MIVPVISASMILQLKKSMVAAGEIAQTGRHSLMAVGSFFRWPEVGNPSDE
jgi:preprotein translocase subunit SecY